MKIEFYIFTFSFTRSARTIHDPPPTTPPTHPCLRFHLAFLLTPRTGAAAWARLPFSVRRTLIRRILPPRPRTTDTISSLAFLTAQKKVCA